MNPFAVSNIVIEEDEKKIEEEFNFDSVVAFKNGYCLLIKNINLPSKTSELLIPKPNSDKVSYGSFWVETKDQSRIKGIKVIKYKEKTLKKCTNIREILEQNLSTPLILYKKSYDNKIVPIKCIVSSISSDLIEIIEEKTGNQKIFSPSNIVEIEKLDVSNGSEQKEGESEENTGNKLKMKKKVEKISEEKIEIKFKESENDETAKISYLNEGVLWAPSYRLDLNTEKKTGVLKLQVVLMNELNDMKIKNFICSGGNFLFNFSDIKDPLMNGNLKIQTVSSQLLSAINNESKPRLKFQPQRMNMQMQSLSNCISQSRSQPSNFSDNQEEEEVADIKDYYHYELKDINLKRNQRISKPIFQCDIKYEEVYFCKIDPSNRKTQQVDHSLKFKNQSKHTWTTAPVIISSDVQPYVAHNMLKFCGQKQSNIIKIDKSLSIIVLTKETVTGHDQKPSKEENYVYDGSIKKQTNTISNKQNNDVKIILKLDFNGVFISSAIDKKKKIKPTKHLKEMDPYSLYNYNTKLEWEMVLKPNQTVDLEVDYTVYSKRYVKNAKGKSLNFWS